MLRYFPAERRRRLAPLFLGVGLFVAGKLAYDEVPRDQELRFVLPEAGVQALKVTYSSSEGGYAGIEQRYPNGSPREFVHTPSLSPGRYDLSIELIGSDGQVKRLARSVTVPSEGALRIPLGARESD
jgi:hypothetical protein